MTPRRGAPGCDTGDRVSLTRRATLEKRNHNGCGGWCASDQPQKIALFYRRLRNGTKKRACPKGRAPNFMPLALTVRAAHPPNRCPHGEERVLQPRADHLSWLGS